MGTPNTTPYDYVPLGEIISLEYGRALSSESREGSKYPVLGSNGIVGRNSEFYSNGPGICVGRKGSVGCIVWVEEDFWPIDTTYFIRKKSEHNLRWLYYLLQWAELQNLNSATGVPGLNREDVYSLKVPVPSALLTDQIAEILIAVDETIERTRAVIAQSRRVKEAIANQTVSDCDLDSKSAWPAQALKQTADKDKGSFSNGPFGSELLTSEFTDTGVPVIYIQDIRPNEYRRVTQIYVSDSKAAALPSCTVYPGDLLITKVGDPPAQTAVYPQSAPFAIITQDVIRLRVNPHKADPEFLMMLLNSSVGKIAVKRIKISGTRDRIALGDFKKIQFRLPPIHHQKRVRRIAQAIQNRLIHSEAYLRQLLQTKSALSQGLLTGKIPILTRGGKR